MVDLVLGAIGVFVVTNIDGLVLLTILFASSTTSPRAVVVGQYLGLTILVAISAIAAASLVIVPRRWVGLLGAIPLALGIRGLARRHDPAPAAPMVGVLAVTALVLSDGADNLAVYTPVFRHLGIAPVAVYISIFAACTAIWCGAALVFARHTPIGATIERWEHVLVPIVFVVIGVVLLATTF
jgi:cadmium resistance protein CadD (predicted permease)